MKQQAHLLSLDQSQVWLACYYHNYCIKEDFIIFILVWLVVGVNIDNRYQQLFSLYLTGILRDSSGQIFPLMRVEEVGRKLFSHFSFSPASLSHSFQSGRPRWRPERIGGGQECWTRGQDYSHQLDHILERSLNHLRPGESEQWTKITLTGNSMSLCKHAYTRVGTCPRERTRSASGTCQAPPWMFIFWIKVDGDDKDWGYPFENILCWQSGS